MYTSLVPELVFLPRSVFLVHVNSAAGRVVVQGLPGRALRQPRQVKFEMTVSSNTLEPTLGCTLTIFFSDEESILTKCVFLN